jgi:hypothetical protein
MVGITLEIRLPVQDEPRVRTDAACLATLHPDVKLDWSTGTSQQMEQHDAAAQAGVPPRPRQSRQDAAHPPGEMIVIEAPRPRAAETLASTRKPREGDDLEEWREHEGRRGRTEAPGQRDSHRGAWSGS